MSFVVKYTGDVKKFIILVLPLVEKYLQDTKNKLSIYAQSEICDILSIMFGTNVTTFRVDPFRSPRDDNVLDIVTFLDNCYGKITDFKLSKPICFNKNKQLQSRKFICIFPKRRETDKIHNIQMPIFEYIYRTIRESQPLMDIYIIGNPLDKLSIKKEKCSDVDRFTDIIDYLKYCKLFITSESNWVPIALICNCRNLLVYHSSETSIDTTYNPFNSKITTIDSFDSPEFSANVKSL